MYQQHTHVSVYSAVPLCSLLCALVLSALCSVLTTLCPLCSVPVFMPAPDVAAVSSRQLNISWLAPSEREVRGVVLSYRVYIYKGSTAAEGPYAPPKKWMVSGAPIGTHHVCLSTHFTKPHVEI